MQKKTATKANQSPDDDKNKADEPWEVQKAKLYDDLRNKETVASLRKMLV